MDRRKFLKGTVAAAGSFALASCLGGGKSSSRGKCGSGIMTCRINPKTGESVSLLGYGCMRWPLIEDESGNKVPDQEGVNALVDKAIASGVNYFDTAPVYHRGLSERVTGEALSRHPRESFAIATKMSNFREYGYEESVGMYRDSFKELKVDYIDYYLLHSVGRSLEDFNARFIDNGILDFLVAERQEGRIRNLGFSFHGGRQVFDQLMSLHAKYHWDFVQIQLNYVDYYTGDARYLYEELASRDIPVVVMEPLLGGRLAKVPKFVSVTMQEKNPSGSIASWAFRFCGSLPKVLTVLSGMTYVEHLEDNLKTFSPLEHLSEEDTDFLDVIAAKLSAYPVIPCTGCDYCVPCPYGIDIPGIFAHYNKCVNEGDIAVSGYPDYSRARRRYLASYAREILPANQADKCIGCGQCLRRCPQEINIPEEMVRLDRYVESLKQNG